MVLYIDETETEEYFIVSGLLVQSEREIDLAYKRLRKSISNYPLTTHVKEKILIEFKSTLIDKQFQKIKIRILNEIKSLNGCVIYSCYTKKHSSMKQRLKEAVYITLLSNIINSINGPVKVIFDRFNKKDFEEAIITSFMDFDNVESIQPFDSQTVAGLQFIDNICSTIRLHMTGLDVKNYYSIISEKIHNV